MLKTLIRHYIYEACIDTFFNAVTKNFTRKPKARPSWLRDMHIADETGGIKVYFDAEKCQFLGSFSNEVYQLDEEYLELLSKEDQDFGEELLTDYALLVDDFWHEDFYQSFTENLHEIVESLENSGN